MSSLDFTSTKFVEVPSKGIFLFLKYIDGDKAYMVKALKPEHRDRPQYRALLKKEFDAVTKLHSTYLPTYYEVVDDTPFGRAIVEEYIAGRSLADYLTESHSVEEHDAVARKLMDALQSIHAHFMLHRNLKPSNIIITAQGDNVKLIDLRPAFADEIQAPFTTTRFQAPEQKDETVGVDTRSDVYALGMILKLMTLPDNFQHVVAQCCSLGRSDRFMDAEEVKRALDARPPVDRSKLYKVLGAVVAVVVVIGVVQYFVKNGFGSSDTADMQETTSYALPDTTSQAATTQTAVADTTTMAAAAAAPSAQVDSVKNVIAAQLEYIYRPYTTDSVGQHARAQIRAQVKRCYRRLMRQLSGMSAEDRDAIDAYFAKYRKNKDAQLTYK